MREDATSPWYHARKTLAELEGQVWVYDLVNENLAASGQASQAFALLGRAGLLRAEEESIARHIYGLAADTGFVDVFVNALASKAIMDKRIEQLAIFGIQGRRPSVVQGGITVEDSDGDSYKRAASWTWNGQRLAPVFSVGAIELVSRQLVERMLVLASTLETEGEDR